MWLHLLDCGLGWVDLLGSHRGSLKLLRWAHLGGLRKALRMWRLVGLRLRGDLDRLPRLAVPPIAAVR